MEQQMWPVDVISLSSVEGKIQPLRIRAAEGFEETVVGNVCEILSTRENMLLGMESVVFLCRILCGKTMLVLELKYYIRSHSWYLSRPWL